MKRRTPFHSAWSCASAPNSKKWPDLSSHKSGTQGQAICEAITAAVLQEIAAEESPSLDYTVEDLARGYL